MARTWRMSRPVCAVCSAISVVINTLAPTSRTKDAAICVTAKTRWRRLVLPVIRTLPLATLIPWEAFPENRPCENQVGDVGTREDEDESGSGEENEEDGPGARGDLVAKQLGPDLEVRFGRICFGMLLGHGPVDGAQLGASLIEGGTGSKTGKELRHAMDAAGDHGCREVVRAGDDVGDDFRLLGIWDGGFEDSDDGGKPIANTAKAKGLAEHGGIAFEHGGPETIREYHGAGGLGAVVLRSDETTEDRVEAHDFEVAAADDARLHFARLTQADHGETDGGEITERGQGFNAGAQILDFRHGERRVFGAHTFGALADVDEAVFVAVDERTEKHAAHQREDGGVGADAEGEGEDHGESEALGAGQRPKSYFQIVKEQRGRKGHLPISLNRSGLAISMMDSPLVFLCRSVERMYRALFQGTYIIEYIPFSSLSLTHSWPPIGRLWDFPSQNRTADSESPS